MSFWDDLTGKSAKKDIRASTAKSEAELAAAAEAARLANEQGRADINTSGTNALAYIGQGRETARTELGAGYDQAAGKAEEYLDKSVDYLRPTIESGNKARGVYDDLQGLSTPEAAAAAAARYTYNPYLEQQEERSFNALDRQFRARGMSESPQARLAAAKASAQLRYDDYNAWKEGLDRTSARGTAAATTAGQFTSNTGNLVAQLAAERGKGMADIESGFGRDQASIEQNRGNALAGQSNKRAELEYGYGASRAGNTINSGNALAQARGIGINNLLKIAGTAAQGYAAYTGVPSFGKKAA